MKRVKKDIRQLMRANKPVLTNKRVKKDMRQLMRASALCNASVLRQHLQCYQ